MKRFLIPLMAFLLAACSHREPITETFRWSAIEPHADSIMLALEHGYMDAMPIDSLLAFADSLGAMASRDHSSDQLRARYHYWKGRLENKRHNLPTARAHLKRAIAISDSSAYPYDAMRFRYLATVFSPGSIINYYSVLKDVESFTQRSDDRLMLATAKLDIGHIIQETGDLDNALAYYLAADSLYQSAGASDYHVKTSLNNASLLHKMGRIKESDAIIDMLRHDPVAISDSDFYTSFLSVAYTIQGDSTDLLNAYRRSLRQPKRAHRFQEVLTDMAAMYLAQGKTMEAERYASEAIDSIGDGGDIALRVKAAGILARTQERLGKGMEALSTRRRLNADQETLLSSRTSMEIRNLENRAQIMKYEDDLRHKTQTQRLLAAVGALGMLSVVLVGWMFLMHRSHNHKMQIANYRLDLEKERRQLVSSAAIMKEKDNVLDAVLHDIETMEKEGKLGHQERQQIEQLVKIHLSGKQERDSFSVVFDRTNPDFSRELRRLYPGLSEGDVRLASYIRIGMQSKQIARMLMIQPDSIKKNRQRLRHRMGLRADESLEEVLSRI